MAGVSSEQGANGNKLDTELNLVPFIDLLSTLVLFLLLTVVWVQVAAIQASVDSRGKAALSQVDQSKLLVRVTRGSIQLTWPSNLQSLGLPQSLTSLDALTRVIEKLKAGGRTPPAAVSGDDSVEYGAVVAALDAVKSAGLTFVALSTD